MRLSFQALRAVKGKYKANKSVTPVVLPTGNPADPRFVETSYEVLR
jgi:hypothetical protein